MIVYKLLKKNCMIKSIYILSHNLKIKNVYRRHEEIFNPFESQIQWTRREEDRRVRTINRMKSSIEQKLIKLYKETSFSYIIISKGNTLLCFDQSSSALVHCMQNGSIDFSFNWHNDRNCMSHVHCEINPDTLPSTVVSGDLELLWKIILTWIRTMSHECLPSWIVDLYFFSRMKSHNLRKLCFTLLTLIFSLFFTPPIPKPKPNSIQFQSQPFSLPSLPPLYIYISHFSLYLAPSF